MNENIDLCEILKGCEEITLWTPIAGNVALKRIKSDDPFPIEVKTDSGMIDDFTKEGRYFLTHDNAECILFPSKDQRDWSKFDKPTSECDIDVNVMFVCSDGCQDITLPVEDEMPFTLRHYAGFSNNKHYCFADGRASHNNSTAYPYRYIIPFNKFDPDNIKGSLKYNIQK